MSMLVNRQYNIIMLRMVTVIVVFLMYYLFIYLYKISISPIESYRGFVYKEITFFQQLLILFFLSIPITFLPLRLSRPSDMAMWILYLIPYTSTVYMSLYITRGTIWSVIYLWISILISLLMMNFSRKHKITINIKREFSRDVDLYTFYLLLFSCICLYLIFVIHGKFQLSIANSYIRRMAAREDSPFMYGYIVALFKSLLTVFGVYLAIIKRKWWYMILIFISVLAIFSFNGTKSTVLNPLILIGIAIYARSSKHKCRLYFLPIILFTVIIVAAIELIFLHSNILSQLIVRRIMAVPGFLNTAFWAFFSNNPKTLMTESIGKFFLDPVYNVGPTFLIGAEYFNKETCNANTGIWLGAFAQFGLLGMLIVSSLAGFCLGIVDNITKKNFFIMGCLVCAFMGLNWSEQMFHTSMLTGGIFYLFIGVLLINKSRSLQHVLYDKSST